MKNKKSKKKANKIRSFLLTFCNNEILNILKQKNSMLINTYSPINLFNTNSSNYEEIKIENEIQKGNYNIFDNQKFENILSRAKTADENKIEDEINKENEVINYITRIKDKKVFVSQKKLNNYYLSIKEEKNEFLLKKNKENEEKKIKFFALKLQKYANKFINYKEKKKKKKLSKISNNLSDIKEIKDSINNTLSYNAKSENNFGFYKKNDDYDFKICLVSMKKKKNYKMKLSTEINNYNNNHYHNHSKKKVQFDIDKNNNYYTKTETNINRIRKIKSYTQLTNFINIDSENY